MKIYVAGPMTGKPGANVLAFNRSTQYLRALGHDVVSPIELNSEIFQFHFGRPYDPWNDKIDYGNPLLNEMFAADVNAVCNADAIALLPGWEHSKGARVELQIAKLLGKAVLDARTAQPLNTIVVVNAAVALASTITDERQLALV